MDEKEVFGVSSDILRLLEKSKLNEASKRSFIIIAGSCPVMVAAPHNVEQVREKKTKFSECDSGTLALMLSRVLDVSCAIKTRCDCDDANWDVESDFRDEVVSFVKNNNVRFLIDLHQLSPKRPQGVILGTGMGINIFGREDLIEVFAAAFEKRGLGPVAVDEVFSASFPYTVSAWVSTCTEIPCFQFELNSGFFMDGDERFAPEKVYSAVEECIKHLVQDGVKDEGVSGSQPVSDV